MTDNELRDVLDATLRGFADHPSSNSPVEFLEAQLPYASTVTIFAILEGMESMVQETPDSIIGFALSIGIGLGKAVGHKEANEEKTATDD